MFCPFFVPFSEQVLTFALFRCHDVGGRDPDVQFSDSETCRQEEIPLRRPQQRPPGDKNEQKINSLPPEVNNNSNNNQPTNQQQHAMMQTSNTKAAFVLGDPSKGSHAAESKEEMMARAVRMKRKTKSCDA